MTQPVSRWQAVGGTPGSGMFKIEQQPLEQEVWGEALEMQGADALKDATGGIWREKLR